MRERITQRLLIGLVPLLALAFAACGGNTIVFDGVVEVKLGDVTVRVTADGNVALADTAEASFGVAGTVVEVLAEEGEAVTEGQVLARLGTAELDVALAKAESGVAVAVDAMARLREPPSALDVELAQDAVDGAIQGLADAEADLAAVGPKQAKAVDDAAEALAAASDAYILLFRRYYGFVLDANETGSAPADILAGRGDPDILEFWRTLFPLELQLDNVASELDLAWDAIRQAGVDHEAAQVTQGKATTTAEKAVATAKAALQSATDAQEALAAGPDAVQVQLKEVAIAAATLARDAARDDLAAATLRAPTPGVVTQLAIEVGDTVLATTTAAVVVDPSALEVDALVDEVDVLRLAVGQAAVVTPAASPIDTLPGRVAEIGLLPVVKAGLVRYPVRVTLDSAATLRHGMTVFVEIEVERREGVLVVPVGALRREGTQQVVQRVADDGLTDRRTVRLGAVDDFNAEVISGLVAGNILVDFSATVQQSDFLDRGRSLR